MSKKDFFVLVFFLLITLNYSAFAQNSTSVKEEIIFVNTETAPKFSGGMDAFYTFFNKKFVMQNNFRGNNTAIATFVIEKDGSLSDIKVINNLGKNTNNEILRVLSLSPKWIPGKNKGNPVRTHYRLPININKR